MRRVERERSAAEDDRLGEDASLFRTSRGSGSQSGPRASKDGRSVCPKPDRLAYQFARMG